MKFALTTISAMIAALFCGCYSVDVASSRVLEKSALKPSAGTPIEHVVVSNYGWLLFNRFPILCGNGAPNAFFPWSFFCDYTSEDFLHSRLMEYADERDADIRDLSFYRDEEIFINIPGMEQFPVPIPYILCFREVQFSGVLTRRQVIEKPLAETGKEGGAE